MSPILQLAACAGAILLTAGCTTFSTQSALQDAQPRRKALFLALYPELTEEQRKEFLTSPAEPIELIREWKVGNSSLVAEPEHFGPRRLVIETQAVLPIKSGRTVPMQAFLEYPNKKRFEVTKAVTWKSAPTLAWTAGPGVIDYECLAQDVVVSADFLGELATNFTLPFKKEIRALDLGLAEPSQVIDSGEFLQMRLTAFCKDGTQSNVACQANWTVDPKLADLSGCGALRILSQEILNDAVITVRGAYAGKEMTRQVHFGVRKKH